MFEAGDGVPACSGAIGAVSGAGEDRHRLTGGYETRAGGYVRVRIPGAGGGRAAGEGLSRTPAPGRGAAATIAGRVRADLRRRPADAAATRPEKLTERLCPVRQRGRLRVGDGFREGGAGGDGHGGRGRDGGDARMTRRGKAAPVEVETQAVRAPLRAAGAPSRAGRRPNTRSGGSRRPRPPGRRPPRCGSPGLGGRNLELVEHRVLKRLSRLRASGLAGAPTASARGRPARRGPRA